jgi:hypothetical protein
MKCFSFIIIVFATLLFSQLSAYADEQAILYLSPQLTPIVGKNMNVNVLIKDIPLVYGVGFQLNIDSEYLEVVDVDNNEAGIQIQAGDFFSTYAYFFNNVVNMNTATSIHLDATNPDGEYLKFILIAGPEHGRLSDVILSECIYTPDNDYIGSDSFTYQVSDGELTSRIATVAITIQTKEINAIA